MRKNDKSHNKKLDVKSWESVTHIDPLKQDNIMTTNYKGYIKLDPDKDSVLDFLLCEKLEKICPTNAISYKKNHDESIWLDNGKCIFCGNCYQTYPNLIKISNRFDFAKRKREDLIEKLSGSTNFRKTYDELGRDLKLKFTKLLEDRYQSERLMVVRVMGAKLKYLH